MAYQEISPGDSDAWDLWTVSLRTDAEGLYASAPEPFLKTTLDERHLSFSPDGRWVAYAIYEPSTGPETYVRTFPDDGRRWKVSDGAGKLPQWSLASRELLYEVGSSIMVAPYSTRGRGFRLGKPRLWSQQAVDGRAIMKPFSLAPDGSTVTATVADLGAEKRSRHTATLWTNALAEIQRRAPARAR